MRNAHIRLGTDKSFRMIRNLGIFSAFLFVTVSAIYLYSPVSKSNAATTAVIYASQTLGPNTIAMATTGYVGLVLPPTPEQQVYTINSSISVLNTCAEGATVSMSTNSASNKLTRIAGDTLTKEINPTTGSTLANNSWGYSLNGTNYYAVPAKTGTPAIIYNSNHASTNPDDFDVIFGLKVDDSIPAGTYQNDILYTVAVKPECLTYDLTWDLNGGTGASGVDYTASEKAYGSTINLAAYLPTREGYHFLGWNNGRDNFTGSEVDIDINERNQTSVTMTARWASLKYNRLIELTSMQDPNLSQYCSETYTPTSVSSQHSVTVDPVFWDDLTPTATLKDLRDNKKYVIQKLPDGNCWMSQNLELDLTAGVALTNDTTDLNSVTSWTPGSTTETTRDNVWDHTVTGTAEHSYHPISGEDYFRDGHIMSSSPTGSGEAYYWEKAGNYYTWFTATAMSVDWQATDVSAQDSICPKGWQLPIATGSKSFENLYVNTYNNIALVDILSPEIASSFIEQQTNKDPVTDVRFYNDVKKYTFVFSGQHHYDEAGMLAQESIASLWTATADGDRDYARSFLAEIVNEEIRQEFLQDAGISETDMPDALYIANSRAVGKGAGLPIRCVAR